MKILLDTNIILDILDNTRRNAPVTGIMIDGLLKHSINFCCSMDALSTITHIMRLKGESALTVTRVILDQFLCLDLISRDALEANKILESGVIKDYEDAQIISTAIRSNCVTFITNDKEVLSAAASFKNIEIISPESVLEGMGYKRDLFNKWVDENSNEFKVTQMDEKAIEEILIESTLGEVDLEPEFEELLKQHIKDLRSGKIVPRGVTKQGKSESLLDFATDEEIEEARKMIKSKK